MINNYEIDLVALIYLVFGLSQNENDNAYYVIEQLVVHIWVLGFGKVLLLHMIISKRVNLTKFTVARVCWISLQRFDATD